MLTLTFGTPEEAARVARRLNAIHARVRGRLSEPAGAFPAGAGYSARDPALLRWVHATLLDALLRTYELYVAPLTPEEQDRYCAEASSLEGWLAMPEGCLPRSAAELRHYLAEMLAGEELAVTETARVLAREVLEPPVPPAARPLLWLVYLPSVGLLPPRIRDAYGFPWDARHQAAFRHSARLVRHLQPLLPAAVRHWPAARSASVPARR